MSLRDKPTASGASWLRNADGSCQQCGAIETELRRRVLRNGTVQIVYQCLTCGRNASNPMPHASVKDADALPLFDHELHARWTELKQREAQRKSALHAEFFRSRAWRELRYKALRTYGAACMACGRTDGELHVDHIKPRSKFPELALDITNLQILCADCNLGKGAWDQTDWRGRNEP